MWGLIATIIHNINKLDNEMSNLDISAGLLSLTSIKYNKY